MPARAVAESRPPLSSTTFVARTTDSAGSYTNPLDGACSA
jgi:hypothetical protein